METRLAVPFSVPLLGDPFTTVKNPMIFSSIDFFVSVTVRSVPLPGPELIVPIFNPQLRRTIAQILKKRGISGQLLISPQPGGKNENDFLATASLLYIGGIDNSESGLPAILDRVDDRAFFILSRALTSLSGGFVVCRRGEGLISLDGCLDASIHLKLKGSVKNTRPQLNLFSSLFPDLAEPLWHLTGHLVLEGGKAIRRGDSETMGKLLNLESSLAQSVGLVKIGDLCRTARLKGSYGKKVMCSNAMRGELILAPKEILPLPSYQSFHFTQEGVHEVEKC